MRILVFLLLAGCVSAWAQQPQKKQPKAPTLVKQNEAMKKESRQLDGVSKTMKKRNEKPVDNSKRNER